MLPFGGLLRPEESGNRDKGFWKLAQIAVHIEGNAKKSVLWLVGIPAREGIEIARSPTLDPDLDQIGIAATLNAKSLQILLDIG
ncbi:MAG: hypothetical protein CM15mP47_3080 [Methanobacteriota archaeon]|nr:MAG: hypothetical protein CM15mP47_3080 [Euryarchaeota archaeon]